MQIQNIQIIQAYSHQDREDLLPAVVETIVHCGGWVVERRDLSEMTLGFQMEIELRRIVEFYAGLLGTGMEMTRSGHRALSGLCTCGRYIRQSDLDQVLQMQLEVSFLHEIAPHWLMLAQPACA